MPLLADYATIAELKSFLRITDTVDDAELTLAVTTASRVIDQAAGRRFGQDDTVTTRYYTAADTAGGMDLPDDISTASGLVVAFAGTNQTIDTTFRLRPYNATLNDEPFTRIEVVDGYRFPTGEKEVAITAQFGWPAVPSAVKFATLVQAGTILKGGRDSPLGIAGSPEFGNELRLSTRLHPIAAEALRPYAKTWGVA